EGTMPRCSARYSSLCSCDTGGTSPSAGASEPGRVTFRGRRLCIGSGANSLRLRFRAWLASFLSTWTFTLRASTAAGIRLVYPFFFFLVDEVRAGDASPGMSSGLISSRTLLSEPEDPGLSAMARFHGPGDSPRMSGEGRGVMSVMAAKAGELMAEPGES